MDQSKNEDGWSKFAKGDVNYETFYYVGNMILAMCGTVLNVWALAILLQPSLRIKGKFVLIISMSVIDLLACLSMIGYLNYDAGSSSDHISGGEVWGNILCRLVLNRYLPFWLSAISAWHVVMICIERYISVRSPDWYDMHFTKLYQLALIGISVLIGTVSMSPNVTTFKYSNGTCLYKWPSDAFKATSGIFQFNFMVITPIGMMGVLYYKLYQRYKKFEPLLANAPVAFDVRTKQRNKSQKVFRTVLFLVIFFVVSWVPSEMVWLCYTLQLGNITDQVFVGLPYLITQSLTLLNSVCNPILYASSFGQFRYRFNSSAQLVKEFTIALICLDVKKFRQLRKLHTSGYVHPSHNNYRISTTDPPLGYGSNLISNPNSHQISDIQSNWPTGNKAYRFLDSTESNGGLSESSEGSFRI